MSKKKWPVDCIWPEPVNVGSGGFDYDEDTIPMELDEDTEELIEVKEYFDSLVKLGRLDDEYCLNTLYEDVNDSEEDEWQPEMGEDYWDGERFAYEMWQEDLSESINCLKLYDDRPNHDLSKDPVSVIESILGYRFVNENLLRQAFTRRAFQIEYGLSGSYEELEFVGDAMLSAVVTKEIMRQYSRAGHPTDAPFQAILNEGEMSRIREQFTNKEYLSQRCKALGLDAFILYGTGEQPTESAREDVMEALIGAVFIDSRQDRDVLEKAADNLIGLQLSTIRAFTKRSFMDIFNSWHQGKFGRMPEYVVYRCNDSSPWKKDGEYYKCDIIFYVPENDKGIEGKQCFVDNGETRSLAREHAAELAYRFIVNSGLWMNLKDANLVPSLDNSINQLQELNQKKYVEKPEYTFEPMENRWKCDCYCGEFHGAGIASGKVKAKKRAAFMVLIHLLKSAGICKKEWESEMWRSWEEN